MAIEVWITAIALAVSCSLLGHMLVLRSQGLLGDALSHSILPGIVGAFFLTGSRHTLVMLVGATFAALVSQALIQALQKIRGLKADASMSVVFSGLFALGLLLLALYGARVDLDPDCVLFGELILIPLEPRWTWGAVDFGPRSTALSVGLLLCVLVYFSLCRKTLMRWSFDESFAKVSRRPFDGVQILIFHVLVALSLVIALRAVGVIMVVGLLTIPAFCARVLSARYWTQVALMMVVVAFELVVGLKVSIQLDLNPGPIVMLSGLSCFCLALLIKRCRSPKNKVAADL